MLGPNYSTVDHIAALIMMLRPSLVKSDTRFTFKERIVFSLKNYFSGYFVLIYLKTLHCYTNLVNQLQYCLSCSCLNYDVKTVVSKK